VTHRFTALARELTSQLAKFACCLSWAGYWFFLLLKANMQWLKAISWLIKTQSAQSQEAAYKNKELKKQKNTKKKHTSCLPKSTLLLTINRSGAKPPSKLFAAFVSNTRPSLPMRLCPQSTVYSLQSALYTPPSAIFSNLRGLQASSPWRPGKQLATATATFGQFSWLWPNLPNALNWQLA